MDEKEFLKALVKPPKQPGMVDGQFHAMDKEKADQMRAIMHANIDSIFDKLVFDEKGFCVSPISIDQKRDWMSLAVDGSRLVHVPTAYTLSIKVEETLDQLAQSIEKARG